MLKKLLVLAIAITVIVAAPRASTRISKDSIPLADVDQLCPNGPVFHVKCNICYCSMLGNFCTNVNCELLPEDDRRNNTVVELPKWPQLKSDRIFGQVYQAECGLCVQYPGFKRFCYLTCKNEFSKPISN